MLRWIENYLLIAVVDFQLSHVSVRPSLSAGVKFFISGSARSDQKPGKEVGVQLAKFPMKSFFPRVSCTPAAAILDLDMMSVTAAAHRILHIRGFVHREPHTGRCSHSALWSRKTLSSLEQPHVCTCAQ